MVFDVPDSSGQIPYQVRKIGEDDLRDGGDSTSTPGRHHRCRVARIRGNAGWAIWMVAIFEPSEWILPDAGEVESILWPLELIVTALAFTGLGALILTVQPRNRAGLVCLSLVALPIVEVLPPIFTFAERIGFPAFLADCVFAALFMLAFVVPFTVLPLVLPDGRLPNPVWRLALWMWLAVLSVELVVRTIANRDEVLSEWAAGYFTISAWAYFVGTWAVLFSVIHRVVISQAEHELSSAGWRWAPACC